MSILTTEQIFLSPWHAVGLKCNSHSQMLSGCGRGAISCTHSRGGGGGLERDENATGREPVLKLQREELPASLSCVGHWRTRSPWKPEDFSAERSAGARAASPGGPGPSPWGSAFLNALPASTKQVAASCLFWSCRCSWAAWQKAFPAAGTEKK